MKRSPLTMLVCLPISLAGLVNCAAPGSNVAGAGEPGGEREGLSADAPVGAAGEGTSRVAAGAAAAVAVAERDLAVVFDPLSPERVRAAEARDDGDEFLPREWFAAAADELPPDSGLRAGGESPYATWELASVRADVCAPLGPTPANVARWCWPELRLVWQSINHNFRLEGYETDPEVIPAYPEDRALHATYDVAPEAAFDADESAEARALRDAIAAQLRASNAVSLPAEKVARFEALRDRAVARFVREMRRLRAGGFPAAAYGGIATRPEFSKPPARRTFVRRVRKLLNAFAPAPSLKQLTGFTLLSGRQPQSPFDSSWNFVSLRPDGEGGVAAERPVVRSRFDARPLFTASTLEFVLTAGVDRELRNAFEGFRPADRKELLEVMVQGENPMGPPPLQTPAETAAARARLADRRQVQVTNTRCAACHQLRTDEFGRANFHNFSSFGFVDITATTDRVPFVDLGFSVSPRVTNDVAYDLAWLRERDLDL
jgi:hypothetical protein